MDMISLGELDMLFELLYSFIENFETFFGLLLYSANDFLAMTGVPVTIPAWLGGDVTPLLLMIGVGLPFYVGYQFLTWLLNLVT